MSTTVNRGTIISAALDLVGREGIGALTMRRLATEMGTKPMTLYYHVPNKEALLQELLDRTASDIPWTTATGEPRDRMVSVIVEMAEQLARIDWIVPVLRTATRVGAPALTLQNQFVEAAFELGATEQQALDTWRSCWYLVSSDLMWQRTKRDRGDGEGSWHETIDPDEIDNAPTIRRLLPQLSELSDHYDLGHAVADQIDGAVARWRR
jgi:AcrR family transcriptional regulator